MRVALLLMRCAKCVVLGEIRAFCYYLKLNTYSFAPLCFARNIAQNA